MGSLLNAIAAGPNPVQIQSPLQRAGQLAQVQELRAGAQAQQLKNEQIQRAMASQDAISRAWRDAGGDLEKTVQGAVNNGALPEDVVALQQHVLKTKADIAGLEDKALEQHAKHADIAAGHLNALLAQPEDRAAQAWTPLVSQLMKSGDLKPEDMQAAGISPTQYPGHEAAQNFLLGLNGYKNAVAQEQKNRELKSQETTSQAAATNAQTNQAKQAFEQAQAIRARGIQASSGLENPNLPVAQGQAAYQQWAQQYPDLAKETGGQWNPQAMANLQRQAVPIEKQPTFDLETIAAKAAQNANPDADNALVDSVIDPKANAALNQMTKGRIQAVRKLGLKDPSTAIAGVLKDSADQIGRTETAVATARAEGPFKIAQAVAQAKAMVGTGPTANVPPHLAVPAISAYEKAGTDYANAQSASDEMKTIVDLARGGNKLAYAYAPVTGVLTINTANGTKRINMPEIESYGGAGSLADKIKGYFGKQVSGASIPSDILDAMEGMHSSLQKVAKDKYSNSVKVINNSYGSRFEPVDLGPTKSEAPNTTLPSGHKVGDAVSIHGKKMKITAVHPDGTFDAN